MANKKSQASGAGAAVLIAIITALIILYILFLPPEKRAALLEEEEVPVEKPISVVGNLTLLLEAPGRLDYLKEREIEHSLPSVTLSVTERSEELKAVSSIYIKSGWFDRRDEQLTFKLDDIEHTKRVLLAFNVRPLKRQKGRLVIKLNGNEIYNSIVTTPTIEPLRLPKEYWAEDNTLSFEVSGVGIKFWTTNEYFLDEVRVIADIIDITTQKATNVFLVTTAEKNNLERVTVRFFPHCNQIEVGPLEIELNAHSIFTAVPNCGYLRPIEIDPHYLISGENTLSFRTTRGIYVIDQILVKTELKALIYPTYYFELSSEQAEDIADGRLNAMLYLDFVNDIDYKKAQIFVSGHLTHLDQTAQRYSKNINTFVQEGSNAVEIIPQTTLDIIRLAIVLEQV